MKKNQTITIAFNQNLKTLDQFIGPSQLAAVRAGFRGEEWEFFADKIRELAQRVVTMPKTYDQDGQANEAIVYLHYFAGGTANWYITEKDMYPEQHQAFGLADLFGDGGELGYINIKELLECGVELDFHFTPRRLREVQGEAVAQGSEEFHQFLGGLQS